MIPIQKYHLNPGSLAPGCILKVSYTYYVMMNRNSGLHECCPDFTFMPGTEADVRFYDKTTERFTDRTLLKDAFLLQWEDVYLPTTKFISLQSRELANETALWQVTPQADQYICRKTERGITRVVPVSRSVLLKDLFIAQNVFNGSVKSDFNLQSKFEQYQEDVRVAKKKQDEFLRKIFS